MSNEAASIARLEEVNAKLVEALEAINADQSIYGSWAMEASISGDEFNRRAGLILKIRAALAAAKEQQPLPSSE